MYLICHSNLPKGNPLSNFPPHKDQDVYEKFANDENPLDFTNLRIAKIREVFPDPDSPTTPIVSPMSKLKLTFLIAFT